MVSPRIATFIAIAAFAAGGFVMSPVPQAIAAVIATDVQCTGCVGTADLAGNAITSAKIKDGEVKTDDIAVSAVGSARIKDNDVKAQDLAPDSVGGSELQGVSKLIFVDCSISDTNSYNTNQGNARHCTAAGAYYDDRAVVSNNGNLCYVMESIPTDGAVYVR